MMTEESHGTHEPQPELSERLLVLKKEVDAIQIKMMEAERPWYRQASTLIAVMALAFSFGTTFVSYYRTAELDRHAAQVELRDLLQRIVALPRENFDLMQRYRGYPLESNQLAGYINNENLVLTQQAAAILKRIPERVSGAEYYAVAQGLISSGVFEPAIELFEQAASSATTVATAVAAHRSLGVAAYNNGQVEIGRRAWQAALDVFDDARFAGAPPAFRSYTHALTLARWAQVEGWTGHCQEAQSHLEEARALLAMMPATGSESLIGEVEQIEGQVGTCRPNLGAGGS